MDSRFGSRAFLGGVDPSSPLSPRYAGSRFDSFNRTLRRRLGHGGVAHRVAAPPAPAQRKKDQRQAPGLIVPFGAAAHEHSEGPFLDTTFVPGSNTVQVYNGGVPSHGFLRGVWIYVTCSGGVAGTAHEDAPWNLLDRIELRDVNGGEIFSLDGYNAFLASFLGGYDFIQDPRMDPHYVGTTPNFAFAIWVPVEIHHSTGLGSLANQNAAAEYKLTIRGNTSANVWSVAPTTIPTVRVRCYLETWTLPDKTDPGGRVQAQLPPLHGTTQFWSVSQDDVASGNDSLKLTRLGNMLRAIILVTRNGAGARNASILPELLELHWDQRILLQEHRDRRRSKMARQFITSSAGLPTGVYAFNMDTDILGHAGDGTTELWLPTRQSTRMEFKGAFSAGSVQVLTNDVAPVEVNQARRYVETSETGFEPSV